MDEILSSRLIGLNAFKDSPAWSLNGYVSFYNQGKTNKSEQLQFSFDEAEKIFEEHPDLENAVKEENWDFVKAHPALRSRPKPPSPKQLAKAAIFQISAVRKAWETTYQGDTVDLFLKNLNKMLDSDKPYSKQIAIIQSSGSGKSRMVHEAANKVFTFPINLRPDESGYGYPPADREVLAHFLAAKEMVPMSVLATYSGPDKRDLAVATGKARFLRFLAAAFEGATHELDQYSERPFTNRADLAKWWNLKLNQEPQQGFPWRRDFYDKCITNARQFSNEIASASVLFAQEVAAAEKAQNALTKLKAKINDSLENASHVDGCLDFLLYFDESHSLREQINNDPYERTLHDVLESAVDRLVSQNLFIVYLSTNSSLAVLAPSAQNAHSMRILLKKACLRPPITETPFDCGTDLPLNAEATDYNRDTISSIEFLSNFGRPLWWTLFQAMKKTSLYNLDAEILMLARAKLLGQRPEESPSLYARIAVLDVLLMFDYEPHREEAQRAEDELVQSHMRTIHSVLENRMYFRSGYPSEPLLAEAACLQLYEWNRMARKKNSNADVQYDILSDVISESRLIDLGKVGELLGRDRIMKAYIRAVVKEHQNSVPPRFSKGCLLTTMIQEMFVESMANTILESKPDNIPHSDKGQIIIPKSFKNTFETAVVRITHFVKFVDDSAFSQDALLYMYLRGAAIWCREGQDYVDIMVPICTNPAKPRSENMTVMFVQLKWRLSKSAPVRVKIDASRFREIFPLPTAQHVIPYISLVMELGVTSPPHKEPDMPTRWDPNSRKRIGESDSSDAPPPKKSRNAPSSPSGITVGATGSTHHPQAVHPRYSIFAYGCSNTVYADIQVSQHEGYERILATRRLLKDHSRTDAESLLAVKRTKPFWAGGPGFFGWTGSKFLNGDDPDVQREEGVVELGEEVGSDED